VEKRVQNWSDVKPWVSSENQAEEKASLDTEAIINAAVLASHDARKGHGSLSPLARQAFDNLWALQTTEGAWAWMNYHLEPWESNEGPYYGAALAAVAVGMAPGDYASDPSIQDNLSTLRQYLGSGYSENNLNLHSQVYLLWASNKLTGILEPVQQSEIVERVLESQNSDGGWSLPSLVGQVDEASEGQGSDGYATGLVVYVLKQAGKSSEAQKGLQWLADNQNEEGYWLTATVNQNLTEQDSFSDKFMWDASTAFAVLALAETT
jgi:squalene-hopene/tetraprenyl-beta-curcumene cyclase